ncbi:MAG: 30S ribosomal protein S24e [Candidatus Thermoplasmatota archaeon]|jgi:small subunit ribosomal protein S24e|nr:30S ribosomal protein S24e [Candidatus Thermoplasmatota archaeon]MCL5785089.1 30S ribosomal protein S24e [Candidatus Thermoplasmatota archaeon]
MSKITFDEVRENTLLHRKEVQFTLSFGTEITPSRDSVRTMIAKNLKADKDLVIVERIVQEAGKHEARGYSKIYTNKESALLYEPDYQLFRNGLKQEQEASN